MQFPVANLTGAMILSAVVQRDLSKTTRNDFNEDFADHFRCVFNSVMIVEDMTVYLMFYL